jgi:hypothetical protein
MAFAFVYAIPAEETFGADAVADSFSVQEPQQIIKLKKLKKLFG